MIDLWINFKLVHSTHNFFINEDVFVGIPSELLPGIVKNLKKMEF